MKKEKPTKKQKAQNLSLRSLLIAYAIGAVGSLAVLFILRGFKRKKSFSLLKHERYLTLEDFKKQANN